MARLSGSLDANAILRLVLNDIPAQHKAVVKLLDKHDGQFAVADVAIIEVVFVLNRYYNLPRSVVCEAIDGLIGLPQLNCNRALIKKALPLYKKHPKLSFEDCCLAVYADLNDASPLFTFDQKLAKQVDVVKLIS